MKRHGCRTRPWPHCVRWGPSFPSPKGHSPQFSAHVCCGQTAGWIKMPVVTEVGLGQDEKIVRWETQLPLKGGTVPTFPPMSIVANGWMNQGDTLYQGGPRPRRHCVRWGPSSPPVARECTAGMAAAIPICHDWYGTAIPINCRKLPNLTILIKCAISPDMSPQTC